MKTSIITRINDAIAFLADKQVQLLRFFVFRLRIKISSTHFFQFGCSSCTYMIFTSTTMRYIELGNLNYFAMKLEYYAKNIVYENLEHSVRRTMTLGAFFSKNNYFSLIRRKPTLRLRGSFSLTWTGVKR